MTDLIIINGFIFGLVLAAPVGPVGVLCVQRTLSEGRMHGLLSGLGAAVADAIYGAIAAFGVSAVQLWIVDHQSSLRTIGGIVLLLTGVAILTNQLQILGFFILEYFPIFEILIMRLD